jgi:hypothetical protein
MAFWTDAAQGQEPKRKFRFQVQLGAYVDGAVWYTKTVKKPSFQITEIDHSYLNHKFYYPGRTEWQTVDITLVDPVSPDAAANTLAIISAAGYNPPTNSGDLSTMSKEKAVNKLGSVVINQIDSDGNQIESWTLRNAFITNVDFGDLSYEDDALSEITLTLRYDWATFTSTVDSPPIW